MQAWTTVEMESTTARRAEAKRRVLMGNKEPKEAGRGLVWTWFRMLSAGEVTGEEDRTRERREMSVLSRGELGRAKRARGSTRQLFKKKAC